MIRESPVTSERPKQLTEALDAFRTINDKSIPTLTKSLEGLASGRKRATASSPVTSASHSTEASQITVRWPLSVDDLAAFCSDPWTRLDSLMPVIPTSARDAAIGVDVGATTGELRAGLALVRSLSGQLGEALGELADVLGAFDTALIDVGDLAEEAIADGISDVLESAVDDGLGEIQELVDDITDATDQATDALEAIGEPLQSVLDVYDKAKPVFEYVQTFA